MNESHQKNERTNKYSETTEERGGPVGLKPAVIFDEDTIRIERTVTTEVVQMKTHWNRNAKRQNYDNYLNN